MTTKHTSDLTVDLITSNIRAVLDMVCDRDGIVITDDQRAEIASVAAHDVHRTLTTSDCVGCARIVDDDFDDETQMCRECLADLNDEDEDEDEDERPELTVIRGGAA